MRLGLRLPVVLVLVGLALLAAGCGSSSQTGPTGRSGSFASAKNCFALGGLAARIASVTAATYGSHPQALEHELRVFAATAPADVKADFETLATGLSGYVSASEKSGYTVGSAAVPTTAQIAALVKAAKTFNTSQVKTAEQHLSAWEQANCK